MPALLALLSSALWGTSDFLGGTLTRRLPGTSVVGASQLAALLLLVPLTAAVGDVPAARSYVVPGMLAGLVGMVALAAFYRALATGTMGVVAPIAALGVVVPVVVGIASGERPSGLQVAGIVLAIVGVVLASGPELSGRGRGAAPLLLAAVSALGFGAVFVLIAQGAGGGGTGAVVMVLLTMRLTSVLTLTALWLLTGGRDLGVRRRDLPLLAVVGVFDVSANAAFAVATQGDLVSVTSVLASLYPVTTVLLARRFHAERLSGLQLVGVTGALVGVVALAGG